MSVADKFNPPIFATADSHFPSMDITNIDALALQNEVNLLRKEINTIKDSRNADNDTLVEIKTMLTEMKNTNVKSSTINDTTDKSFFKEKKSFSKALKENFVTNSTHSSSTNINSNIESSAFNGIEKWKITKKRRKPVTTVGKKVTTIFKSVKPLSRPSEIFVSRFEPHTTIDSVENYVKPQFSDCKSVTCSKLSTRYSSYTSFKIVMHGISLQDALNLDNWPEEILLKTFYSVLHHTNTENAVGQSGACCHSFRIFNIVLLLVDIAIILPWRFILAYVPSVTEAK